MVIIIDHYVMLAYPLRAARWCTARMARWVGTAVILLAVLFNLVSLAKIPLRVVSKQHEDKCHVSVTSEGRHRGMEQRYVP
jgi:hypothetical protein